MICDHALQAWTTPLVGRSHPFGTSLTPNVPPELMQGRCTPTLINYELPSGLHIHDFPHRLHATSDLLLLCAPTSRTKMLETLPPEFHPLIPRAGWYDTARTSMQHSPAIMHQLAGEFLEATPEAVRQACAAFQERLSTDPKRATAQEKAALRLLQFMLHEPDPALPLLFFYNLVDIQKGEALEIDEGMAHCVLSGSAVLVPREVGNTVYGGLTPEPVDREAFLQQTWAHALPRIVEGFEFVTRLDASTPRTDEKLNLLLPAGPDCRGSFSQEMGDHTSEIQINGSCAIVVPAGACYSVTISAGELIVTSN